MKVDSETQASAAATTRTRKFGWLRGLGMVLAAALVIAGYPYASAWYFNWQGDRLARGGHVVEAVRSYREANSERPSPRIIQKIGAVLTRSPEPQAALKDLQTAVLQAPETSDTHYVLGLGLMQSGQTAGAEREFRRAVALDPHNGVAHLALSRLLRQAGRYEAATYQLELAEGNGIDTADLHLQLAEAYIARGDERATRELRATLALQPDSTAAHLRLGCLLLNKDPQEALAQLSPLADDPLLASDDRARALLGLALLSYRQSDSPQAGLYLHQAEDLQLSAGQKAAVEYALGVVRRDTQNGIGAFDAFNAASQAHDTAHTLGSLVGDLSLYGSALTSLRDHRDDQAEIYLTHLVSSSPKDPEYRLELGTALMGLQKVDAAIREFRVAAAISPADPETWLRLSRALFAAGRVAESEKVLAHALHLEPRWTLERPDVLMHLGRIDLAQHRPAAAQLCLQTVLQSHSPMVNTQECMTLLDTAEAQVAAINEARQIEEERRLELIRERASAAPPVVQVPAPARIPETRPAAPRSPAPRPSATSTPPAPRPAAPIPIPPVVPSPNPAPPASAPAAPTTPNPAVGAGLPPPAAPQPTVPAPAAPSGA